MNLSIFCAVYIVQYVGHRIGDYLIQGSEDAQFKSSSFYHRFRHCAMYSAVIYLMLFLCIPPIYSLGVLIVTLIEHLIVDSRKPVIWWKTFFEHKIMGNKEFDIKELPFFVLIDIDQTFHLVRIFIISVVLAYML